MKIVVTGSLGNIGKPLTEQLIKEGHAVTLISSNPGNKQAIETLGAKAAIGSLLDSVFLEEAFTGADAVFCMIPPDYTHLDQMLHYESIGRNYELAIRESAVKRIVHLSSWGAHLPSGTGFIEGSYRVEQLLNAIPDIALTHIRPTSFYYNLEAFIGMIKSAGLIGTVYGGEDKVAMVSPQDIAAVVAAALTETKEVQAICYVTSDDRTCNEIADVLGKAIGIRDLKWLTLSREQVLANLLNAGIPKETATNLVALGMAIHTGKLREDFDRHRPVQGKVSLEKYAEEFARVFNNK